MTIEFNIHDIFLYFINNKFSFTYICVASSCRICGTKSLIRMTLGGHTCCLRRCILLGSVSLPSWVRVGEDIHLEESQLPASYRYLRLRSSRPNPARASHFYVREVRARSVRVAGYAGNSRRSRLHVGAHYCWDVRTTILMNAFVEGRRVCRLFAEAQRLRRTVSSKPE